MKNDQFGFCTSLGWHTFILAEQASTSVGALSLINKSSYEQSQYRSSPLVAQSYN
jgi:hypothetical protein